jgi:hypothetical protein
MVSKIFTIILASCAQAVYDSSDIVPMSKYSKSYRTLSMQECFKADGKMCILKNGGSMIQYTGSSNPGHGMCCTPESANEACITSDKIVCSQPVSAAQTVSIFKGALTDEKTNYQMYAYAPMTTA